MLTKKQFLHLERELTDKGSTSILDVGCGIGKVADQLAKQRERTICGIDLDDDLISEGAAAFGERLDLRVGDFDKPEWEPKSFDAFYCVDSLYFSKDLSHTIETLNDLLKPNGRAILFWTQLVETKALLHKLAPEGTALASVLRARGLSFKYTDFTIEEVAYWKKAKAAIQELANGFRKEGEEEFLSAFSEEIEFIGSYVDGKRLARYCYTYDL